MAKYQFNEKDHLHSLDGKPLIGTSTALQVIAKNLTWWAAETSAVECLEAGEHIPTIREEYLAACASTDKKSAIDALQRKYPIFKKARFAHFKDKNSKAEKGVDLHAELERFVKDMMSDNDGQTYDEKILPFIEWSRKNVKRFELSEAHVFSEKMWTGGIIDCVVELNDGQIGVIDFKSAKESYRSMFIQTAGYDIQLSENGAFDKDGNKFYELKKPISFYAIVPFGSNDFRVDFEYNIIPFKNAFESALNLHRLLTVDKNS